VGIIVYLKGFVARTESRPEVFAPDSLILDPQAHKEIFSPGKIELSCLWSIVEAAEGKFSINTSLF
jgi:hypothetical protein